MTSKAKKSWVHFLKVQQKKESKGHFYMRMRHVQMILEISKKDTFPLVLVQHVPDCLSIYIVTL